MFPLLELLMTPVGLLANGVAFCCCDAGTCCNGTKPAAGTAENGTSNIGLFCVWFDVEGACLVFGGWTLVADIGCTGAACDKIGCTAFADGVPL